MPRARWIWKEVPKALFLNRGPTGTMNRGPTGTMNRGPTGTMNRGPTGTMNGADGWVLTQGREKGEG
eukprot:40208-Chlamydomonas_euryale.AAC.2